jgi:hypothetical protein
MVMGKLLFGIVRVLYSEQQVVIQVYQSAFGGRIILREEGTRDQRRQRDSNTVVECIIEGGYRQDIATL